MRSWVSLVALLLAPVDAAIAQHESPPVPGPPRNVVLPHAQHFVLPNGLQVTLVPYGNVPTVTVALTVPASVGEEQANEVWLSRLTGALMMEGTTNRSAERIAEEAASAGGSVEVWSDRTLSWIEGNVLSEHVDTLLSLIADIALHPQLSDVTLPRGKTSLAREMEVTRAKAYQIGWAAFLRRLYGDQRYGYEFPTDTLLSGFTIDQVRRFYALNYGALRSHVYVVGAFDMATAAATVRRAFGGWRRGTPAPVLHVGALAGVRSLTLIDRPGAVQSSLAMGLRVPSPSDSDRVAFEVADALLGGIWTSRITSNIRDQKGYAYHPMSWIYSFRGESFWSEQADVETSVTGASLKEIINEMERLRASAPTVAELDGIKRNLAGTFVRRFSTQSGVIDELSMVDFQGLGEHYLATYVQRILAVMPATVQRIAQTYLDPSKMAIVVVGDRRTVDSQLFPFRTVAK